MKYLVREIIHEERLLEVEVDSKDEIRIIGEATEQGIGERAPVNSNVKYRIKKVK